MDRRINSENQDQALSQDRTSTKGINKNSGDFGVNIQNQKIGIKSYLNAQLQKMLAEEYKDISDEDLKNMITKIGNMNSGNKRKMFRPLKDDKAKDLASIEAKVQNIEAELEVRREIAARKSRPKEASG